MSNLSDARFFVDKGVSERALKNYLSRSIVSEMFLASADVEFEERLATFLDIGAKYIARSAGSWTPDGRDDARFPLYEKRIKEAHEKDPYLCFEFCIFECATEKGCAEIKIPDWVFKAFDQPVEDRCFDMWKIAYEDGTHVGEYGPGTCNLDNSRLETQMFSYYRACRAIDAGFEGLHWGSFGISSEVDKKQNYAGWTRLLSMVREYAAKHARRGFVFNNAHLNGVIGADGKLLFDFHAKPTRVHPPIGSKDHAPTEEDPQFGIVSPVLGNELVGTPLFGHSLGGMTHSGWSCDSLPYFVELDNWGGVKRDSHNKVGYPWYPWGYDEISWFANQPVWYQKEWLDYAYRTIHGTDPQGFFEMPANRTAFLNEKDKIASFDASDEIFETIKEIWQSHDYLV